MRRREAATRAAIFDLPAAHRRLAATRKAVGALVAFARELAGTADLQPPSDDGELPALLAADVGETAQSAPPIASPPSPPKPRWTKIRRPGPFDVLTWDEIMTVPWVEGDDHLLENDEDER